jgi:hypothetical protein
LVDPDEELRQDWLLMPQILVGSSTLLTIEVGFTIANSNASDEKVGTWQKDVLLCAFPLPEPQTLPSDQWDTPDNG